LGMLMLGLVCIGFFYSGKQYNSSVQVSAYGNEIRNIEVGSEIFNAEIVSSPAKKELGLSGRPGLCLNCAMLFLFDKYDAYSFWMKDMQFDLDIIWIAGDTIVAIEKNAAFAAGMNKAFNPQVKSDKVLEINSGLSDKLNIKVGDKVAI